MSGGCGLQNDWSLNVYRTLNEIVKRFRIFQQTEMNV